MTFRLFTNIATMDSQKHIYEYVSSSGSHRVCTIRLSIAEYSSSGSHRVYTIRLYVAGYSLSGSHRVCTIQLSVAGYFSSGSGLVLLASAEIVPQHCSSPFPSGGTCLPTTLRSSVALHMCIYRMRSGGSWMQNRKTAS